MGIGQRFAVACVGLLAVSTACTQDPIARKQQALERGSQYAATGKTNEAVIEFKNALKVDPEFVPALHALGRTYRTKSWHADAIRELRRAVALQPDLLAARIDLGHVLLEVNAWADAKEQGEAILTADPANPAGPYLIGAALAGRGEPAEALEYLKKAQALGGSTADLQRAQGDAYSRLGRLNEAEGAYRAAIAQSPRHAGALVSLGLMLLRQNKVQAGAEMLAEAKAASPDDRTVRLAMSALRALEGKVPEAIKELEELPLQARTLDVNVALGQLYITAGRHEEALRIFGPLTERLPKVAHYRYLHAHAALGAGRPQEAIADFENLAKQEPTNPHVRYSLGAAYLAAGRPRDALKELEPLARALDRIPDYHLQIGNAHAALAQWDEAIKAVGVATRLDPQRAQSYGVMASIYARRGDLKKAEELYAKALELEPTFTAAHLALGTVYSLEGKPDEALRQYDASLKVDARYEPAILAKVTSLAQQRRVDDAVAFVQATLKADPKNVRLIALLAGLYVTKGDRRRAVEEYNRALEIDNAFAPARFNLARLALAERKEEAALGHLQGILKVQPTHVPAALLAARIYSHQARYDQAIAALEAANKAAPLGSNATTFVLADLYLKMGRNDDAIARLTPIVSASPNLVPARTLLGLAHLGKGQASEALKQFEHVNQMNPKLALNHYYLARAHAARGDVPAAQKAYRTALQLAPKFRQAEVELANLSGQKLDKPDAQTLARRVGDLQVAVQRDPGNVSLRAGLAQAYLAKGQAKEAEVELKKVLETTPTYAPANFTMALLRARERKDDEAAEYLRATVRSDPAHVEANLLLAIHDERKGSREQAIGRLETVLRQQPGLDTAKLRLARLYGETGRAAEGITKAKEVVAAKPKVAEAHLVLGTLYLQLGRTAEAIDSLTRSVQASPDLAPAHFALGAAFAQQGQTERAITEFRKVLILDPKDARAHTNLAAIYAARGQNLDEALALARKANELAPNTAIILDTLGWVHYKRQAYGDAQQALAKAVAGAANNAAIHYHLGMTYYRLGRKEEAISSLRRSLQLDPKLPDATAVAEVLKQLEG